MKKFLPFLLSASMAASAAGYQNVALVSVSMAYNKQDIPLIETALKDQGYQVTTQYLNQVVSDFGYVNRLYERVDSLTKAMADPNVDVLWFVRGGGGSINLLPSLKEKLSELKQLEPKTLVGFSDVTGIHTFVNNQLGWKSVHGVVGELNANVYNLKKAQGIATLEMNKLEPLPSVKTLMTQGVKYENLLPLNADNEKKSISGTLIGGNLTLLKATLGTEFQPDFKDKIILLEGLRDNEMTIDRDLNQLLMVESIKDAKAVIFGEFNSFKPTLHERIMYKSVMESFAKRLDKPVYYFPFTGHGLHNKPLVLNANTSIDCSMPGSYCSFNSNLQ